MLLWFIVDDVKVTAAPVTTTTKMADEAKHLLSQLKEQQQEQQKLIQEQKKLIQELKEHKDQAHPDIQVPHSTTRWLHTHPDIQVPHQFRPPLALITFTLIFRVLQWKCGKNWSFSPRGWRNHFTYD